MQIFEVKENKDEIVKQNVFPNVIKNRFDILFDKNYSLFCIKKKNICTYIPVHYNGQEALLGVYLRNIDEQDFNNFVKFLFDNCKKINRIRVVHTYIYISTIEEAVHWHVELSNSIDEFDSTLSGKTRYNTKWYPKKINKEVGEYTIDKIAASELSLDVINKYLEWKEESHRFHHDCSKYVHDYGITNAYILRTKDEILAIGFISETDKENVFFENFAYEPKYAKYSLGMVLLHAIIKDLIENKKKNFYMLGGDYDYKKRFNGIKSMTRTGFIYRYPKIASFSESLSEKISRLPFRYKTKKHLAKFINFLFYLLLSKAKFLTISE